MSTKRDRSALALAITATALLGCQSPTAPRPLAEPRPETSRPLDVETVPTVPAELAPSRRIHRMTAEQLAASLEVATGQPWASFEEDAATLGRADFSQVTEEGEQISVAFERLFQQAAREACHSAVETERDPAFGGERAILGELDVAAPDAAARAGNLRRLVLRFHGQEVTSDDDPRLEAWQAVLEAPIEPADLELEGATEADVEAVRWEALCIGLATHVDFFTY